MDHGRVRATDCHKGGGNLPERAALASPMGYLSCTWVTRGQGTWRQEGHRGKEKGSICDGLNTEAAHPRQPETPWPWPVFKSLSPELWAAIPLPSSSQTWQRVQSVLKWPSLVKKVPGGQGRQVESPQGSVQGAFM